MSEQGSRPPAVRRSSLRSAVITLAILAALAAWVVYVSVSQVAWECEVVHAFQGGEARRTGASATREEAIRSAVSSACGVLASGMAESIACDNTPPRQVDCRESR
jgi:hypothetical protein